MTLLNRLAKGWDPWRDLQWLQQDLGKSLQGSGLFPSVSSDAPLVNVWRSEEGALITSEIPGLDPEKLDISINGETVTIKGERTAEAQQEKERFHRRERVASNFVRTIQLPFRIDPKRTEARYELGVLRIVLPQDHEDRPQKIAIRTAN